MSRFIFVTGTDTGAGKTVLTSLLLLHARGKGLNAVALKPFCSGGREDAELFWNLLEREVPLDVINPFHFAAPLAPATAAGLQGRSITLKKTLTAIQRASADLTLVEGAGGLLAPLGESFAAPDLIRELAAGVIVAAPNRLGVINHSLLTFRELDRTSAKAPRLALMDATEGDPSSNHNPDDLRRLLPAIPFAHLPRINTRTIEALRCATIQHASVLDLLLQHSASQPSSNRSGQSSSN